MDDFENNEIRIVDYFEDRMSPAEEEAFVRELAGNDELRAQYEDELLMRSLLAEREGKGTADGDPFLQPADEHIDMIGKAMEKNETTTPLVKPLFRHYRLVAAILVAIIAGTLVYLFAIHRSQAPPPVVKGPDAVKPVPDRLRQNIVVIDTAKLIPHNSPTDDEVFARVYTPYAGGDDPVQVSIYYQYYRQGNYGKLFGATDAAVREMGTGENEAQSIAYLHLYKGLGYLADHRPREALSEFERVQEQTGSTTPPFYAAQWYGSLTWLKRQDRNKAMAIARQIMTTSSPYRPQAAKLLKL